MIESEIGLTTYLFDAVALVALLAATTVVTLFGYRFARWAREEPPFIWLRQLLILAIVVAILLLVSFAASFLGRRQQRATVRLPRPVPANVATRDDIEKLSAEIRRCCRVTLQPTDGASDPSAATSKLTDQAKEVERDISPVWPLSAAGLFFGSGLWLVTRKNGTKVPGTLLLLTSGALSLGGFKLLSVDKVFDAKSLVTFHFAKEGQQGAVAPHGPIGINYDTDTIAGFRDGSADIGSIADQSKLDATVNRMCRPNTTAVIAVGRFDRRELRRALVEKVGSNWALAEARAVAVAEKFRNAGCSAVTLAAPPVNATTAATEPQLRLDRSVVVHSYFLRVAPLTPQAKSQSTMDFSSAEGGST